VTEENITVDRLQQMFTWSFHQASNIHAVAKPGNTFTAQGSGRSSTIVQPILINTRPRTTDTTSPHCWYISRGLTLITQYQRSTTRKFYIPPYAASDNFHDSSQYSEQIAGAAISVSHRLSLTAASMPTKDEFIERLWPPRCIICLEDYNSE
jgi:hypothetical protein